MYAWLSLGDDLILMVSLVLVKSYLSLLLPFRGSHEGMVIYRWLRQSQAWNGCLRFLGLHVSIALGGGLSLLKLAWRLLSCDYLYG